jgi:hypothetical protein
MDEFYHLRQLAPAASSEQRPAEYFEIRWAMGLRSQVWSFAHERGDVDRFEIGGEVGF